jgi:hypothetical protein
VRVVRRSGPELTRTRAREGRCRLAPFTFAALGSLTNTNTIDEFQALDKKVLLATTAAQVHIYIHTYTQSA